jgi:hypothetical protein
VAISLLSYAGSVLTLGLFFPFLCFALVLARETRPNLRTIASLALWPLAAALVSAWIFYLQYVPELLGQTASASTGMEASGLSALVDNRLTPFAALCMAFYRLRLFYGWLFAIGGAALFARTLVRRGAGVRGLALPLALAAAATYLGMNFLRAGLGSTHIFQFSKDDLVILPVFALGLGAVLGAMWDQGRSARAGALALILFWAGLGLASLSRDVRGRFIRPQYPPPSASGEEAQEANTTRLPPARLAS